MNGRKARTAFTVERRSSARAGGYAAYDVICTLCPFVSKGWDFRSNALAQGYKHVTTEHMS